MNSAHSDALVIFGITGDLAFKKIIPALENLERRGRLPATVVGVARGVGSREALLQRARESLEQYNDGLDEQAVSVATHTNHFSVQALQVSREQQAFRISISDCFYTSASFIPVNGKNKIAFHNDSS